MKCREGQKLNVTKNKVLKSISECNVIILSDYTANIPGEAGEIEGLSGREGRMYGGREGGRGREEGREEEGREEGREGGRERGREGRRECVREGGSV